MTSLLDRRLAPAWLATLLSLLLAPPGAAAADAVPAPIEDPVGPSPLPTAEARLAAAERRLASEPSARDVQRWAERGGSLDLPGARRLLEDSRAAGALPWVRLRGRFQDTDRIDRDEVGLVDGKREDTVWSAELWLDWDLAEAVAGSARFRAVKELRDQLAVRQAVIHQATLAYHDRQRLVLEDALDPVSGPGDLDAITRRAVRTVRIRELDATLDAMTGGRWARALASLTGRPRVRPVPEDLELPGEPEREPLPPDRRPRSRAVAGG